MCVEWISCRCPLGKAPSLTVLVNLLLRNPNLNFIQNPSRHGFLVADAGGGTLDISSYAIRGTTPLVIEEIAPPDCMSTAFCTSLPNVRFAFQVYFLGLYLLVVGQEHSFKVIYSRSQHLTPFSQISREIEEFEIRYSRRARSHHKTFRRNYEAPFP